MKNISWWQILKLFEDCTKVWDSNQIRFCFFIIFWHYPQKHCKLFSRFQIPNVRLWELRWIIEFDLNLNPKGIARKYSKKLKVRRRKKRQTSSSSSRYTTPLFSEPLTYYTNSKITIGGNNNNLLGRFSFIYIIFIIIG